MRRSIVPPRLLRAAVLLLVGTLLLGAADPSPNFTTPRRLGFVAGDDWEPAIAADRFGHVYTLFSHYGSDPACPACGSPHSELQVSSNGGQTWSKPRPISPSAQRQDDPQIVVDPTDGRTLYASFMQGDQASEYVARSTDFGATWH